MSMSRSLSMSVRLRTVAAPRSRCVRASERPPARLRCARARPQVSSELHAPSSRANAAVLEQLGAELTAARQELVKARSEASQWQRLHSAEANRARELEATNQLLEAQLRQYRAVLERSQRDEAPPHELERSSTEGALVANELGGFADLLVAAPPPSAMPPAAPALAGLAQPTPRPTPSPPA